MIMTQAERTEDVHVDASEQVMGRLATRIAKELLRGKNVYVINADKAVISGSPKFIIKSYGEKVSRGDPYHGPFYPRTPERILKRIVRGMLPKKPRGEEAIKRLRVYRSRPGFLENREFKRFDDADMKKEQDYMELGKLSKRLGARMD